MDKNELDLLTTSLRAAMATASGAALDRELTALGWPQMLAEIPDTAVPLVFGLLGSTGSHAPLINDVLGAAGGVTPLPYAGDSWVVWERDGRNAAGLDDDLPLRPAENGAPDAPAAGALAAGRRAVGWWLTGTSRAMLALARDHALNRVQFGRRLASFQAVRHKLADTIVAIEGAEAVLAAACDELGSALGKAAAGQAALTASKHCQQILGGIGFTTEHPLHQHIRRALVLDGLLGSSRELISSAGAAVRRDGSAPRLVQL